MRWWSQSFSSVPRIPDNTLYNFLLRQWGWSIPQQHKHEHYRIYVHVFTYEWFLAQEPKFKKVELFTIFQFLMKIHVQIYFSRLYNLTLYWCFLMGRKRIMHECIIFINSWVHFWVYIFNHFHWCWCSILTLSSVHHRLKNMIRNLSFLNQIRSDCSNWHTLFHINWNIPRHYDEKCSNV